MCTHKVIGYLQKTVNFVLLLFCVIHLCLVCAGAEENTWYLYYTEPGGTERYYDLKSIIRTSKSIPKTQALSIKRVRTRERSTKESLIKVREKLIVNNPESPLRESRILREINCSRNMIRSLMTSETYKTGFKKIEGKTQQWDNISSNPSYEALREIVCEP
jgi:hypothetical protein